MVPYVVCLEGPHTLTTPGSTIRVDHRECCMWWNFVCIVMLINWLYWSIWWWTAVSRLWSAVSSCYIPSLKSGSPSCVALLTCDKHRLVVLESGLGLESGLESIFGGLGLGLEMKGLGLGLGLAVFGLGLGLGPSWTCYKAHSLQVCFVAYNNYCHRLYCNIYVYSDISLTVSLKVYGQKTTGQKTTGQKTTKNANTGKWTTQTKDHQDKRPPSSKFCSLRWRGLYRNLCKKTVQFIETL